MRNPGDPVELLVTYAMDLLAQTEALHRAICRTQVQLNALRGREYDDRSRRDIAPEKRGKAVAAVRDEVKALLVAVTNQKAVLHEMHRAVRGLKAATDD